MVDHGLPALREDPVRSNRRSMQLELEGQVLISTIGDTGRVGAFTVIVALATRFQALQIEISSLVQNAARLVEAFKVIFFPTDNCTAPG